MARLTSKFWIDAYLLRLAQDAIPVFITQRGDETAGAILVNLNLLDGTARLFHQSFNTAGTRAWIVLCEGSEAEVAEAIKKQLRFDPDLWVIEVESKSGAHLLDDIQFQSSEGC